jgi:ABC-type bacteriocin/lantibiotic exporter with double-glycine peptidase domain
MYIDIYLSVIVLVLVALSILLSNRMSLFLGKKNNEKQIVNSELNQFMIETIKSIGSVVQLNKRQYFGHKYEKLIEKKYRPIIEHVIVGQALYISQLIFSQEIIPFIVLFIGMIFTALGKMTIGTTIIMMNLTIRISKSVQIIGDLLPKKHLSNEIYGRIKYIYAAPTDDDDTSKLLVPDFEKLAIELDEYIYPNTKHSAISNVKLEIEKGDLVSLNGASGKGKTTLVNLISRLLPTYEPSCKILYNGVRIETFQAKDYYKHVLQVGQDTLVVQGTLEENLHLGDKYTKKELDEVIYTCHLENFIKENGMNYYIKENGKNISGGERQRIGLARILLRKPDLLILDEVTSALNEEIRTEIVKRIVNYKEKYNLTIIAISHNTDFRAHSNKSYQL